MPTCDTCGDAVDETVDCADGATVCADCHDKRPLHRPRPARGRRSRHPDGEAVAVDEAQDMADAAERMRRQQGLTSGGRRFA